MSVYMLCLVKCGGGEAKGEGLGTTYYLALALCERRDRRHCVPPCAGAGPVLHTPVSHIETQMLCNACTGRCVSPAFRRRGLAKWLVLTVQAFAVAAGHTRVFLSTVDFNAAPIAMYASMGFVVTRNFDIPEPWPQVCQLTEMEWIVPTPA